MAEPEPDAGEVDEAEEAFGGFVVAGRQAAAVFQLVEASLDHVAQGVRLVEGTHTLSAFKTTAPTLKWPLHIEPADPTKADTTVFQDSATQLQNAIPLHLVQRGYTLRKNHVGTGSNLTCWDSGGTMAALFALENMRIEGNGTITTAYWYRLGRMQVINSVMGVTGGETYYSSYALALMGVGSHIEKSAHTTYGMIGCKSPDFAFGGSKFRSGIRPEISAR